MTTVVLIHGWGGSASFEGWFGWLRNLTSGKGWEIIVPDMPDTNYPRIESWVGKLSEVVSEITDKDIYFVGHSIGCQTIMRYLEKGDIQAKGIVLVAPFYHLIDFDSPEEKEISGPWLNTPINDDMVKKNSGNILAIFSNDDDCVPLSDCIEFEERLHAKVIIKENEGHFNGTESIKEIEEFLR
ncbi:MAG: putative alpha/beta hydrolase family esterase [Patescibacteria group bacterium]|jgi:predicted alpha/beta hydrolase family esterase